jgi:hypothetical protein
MGRARARAFSSVLPPVILFPTEIAWPWVSMILFHKIIDTRAQPPDGRHDHRRHLF